MVEDRENLVRDISAVLNMHCVDNETNTPDFILAEMVVKMLEGICDMNEARDHWHNDIEKDARLLWRNEQLLIGALDRSIHDGESTLVDSAGNPPPHPPREGMVWDLEHTVCDQGHYGISTWKEIPLETPGEEHERHLMSDPKNVR